VHGYEQVFLYDVYGNITEIDTTPGTTEMIGVDTNSNRLTSADGAGNITDMGSDSFAYDAMSRLEDADVHGYEQVFLYDAYGNITEIDTTPGTTEMIGVDTNSNRLTSADYDDAGNVTSLDGVDYLIDLRLGRDPSCKRSGGCLRLTFSRLDSKVGQRGDRQLARYDGSARSPGCTRGHCYSRCDCSRYEALAAPNRTRRVQPSSAESGCAALQNI
jgi:hypothetical protein